MSLKGRKKQISVLALLIVFVLVIFLSIVFSVTHADHEHDHHGVKGTCSICSKLHMAQRLLKSISIAIFVWTVQRVFTTLSQINCTFLLQFGIHTLVSLKVRLNS